MIRLLVVCKILHAALLIVVALFASPISASEYPERTVKIVAPFEAGGTVDAVARFLANRLNARWRVPVIVENRPGAGNIVGASAVAQAKPDGYTLLFANTSISVNPSLYKSLPYDTAKDLAPVVFLSASPNVLLVQKALGVARLPQLIMLAKSRQQPMTFASVGKGSFHHVSMELFRIAAGVKLLHIPYKGAAPAMLAFVRGDVDLYCSDLPGAIGPIRSGDVLPLAITSARRAAVLADVPTMAEAGLPGYAAIGYVGIMTTGGTPRDVIAKLNSAINEVVREPEFSTHFAALGYEMTGGTVEQFTTFIRDDTARYARLIKMLGEVIE
jgi:tripartite-type tricarboxylate transporter receptor subunit TctC